MQSLAGCDVHEKRLDSLRTITNEQDCMIYLSSFIHLLRIIYSSYWIWRVVWGDFEGGWILRPPIIHGWGWGALEQSPTVCQMGQCSDISATSVIQVKTSLSGFHRLWGDTQVMRTHFFTFWTTGCVSKMAQKWSILGKNPQFSSLGATEAPDGC